MAKAKTAAKPKPAAKSKAVKTPPKKALKKPISKPKEIIYSPTLKCSFCGKSIKNAQRLIALDPPSKICICDECVEVCILLLLKESPHEWATRITRLFAIFAEKNKDKLIQDKIKPKTKSRIK